MKHLLMAASLIPVLISGACPKPPTPGSAAPAPANGPAGSLDDAPATQPDTTMMRFSASVAIDARPRGKRFQGVWLRPEGGEVSRYLVAYRARPWWRLFEGQRVDVVGSPWTPDPRSQHIVAEHFRVHSLTVADPNVQPTPRWVKMGPKKRYVGTFQRRSGDPGSKSAGDRWTVFAAEGGLTFALASPEPGPDDLGKRQAISARLLTPSPFVAGRSGPAMWVIDRSPAD